MRTIFRSPQSLYERALATMRDAPADLTPADISILRVKNPPLADAAEAALRRAQNTREYQERLAERDHQRTVDQLRTTLRLGGGR
jgi:hypothetical protein